jgi:hypothetical protein
MYDIDHFFGRMQKGLFKIPEKYPFAESEHVTILQVTHY